MKDIAIKRLRLIPIQKGPGLCTKQRLVILSELATLGVHVENPEYLEGASEAFFLDYGFVVQTLRKMRGGDVSYVPLFARFPEDIPDDDEYFAKRIIGYLGNVIELFDEGTRLDNGRCIPDWLFDLKDFGADPVTQFQTKSLWKKANERLGRRQKDSHMEWTTVRFVWTDEVMVKLKMWLHASLTAKSSVKEALHKDIQSLLKFFGTEGLDPDAMTQKENRSLVSRILWEDENYVDATALAKTPTDVLRLFASLTGTDISLAKPIRFPKLSRKQRRAILGALEGSPSLEEDLKRYERLWLEIGRFLHPGEYKKKFPKTAAAFDKLRNGTIVTFDGQTERLLASSAAKSGVAGWFDKQDPDIGPLLEHLTGRPGVLARRLHHLLRTFPRRAPEILDAFEQAASGMTVKSLIVLKTYFATINDQACRTVINKRGKIKVLPNNARGSLSDETIAATRSALDKAVIKTLRKRESWAGRTVRIDPALADYTVPLSERAASEGLIHVGRGTRLGIDFDKVLRLFVYWKEANQRTDLDLSVIQFDKDFKYAGHVSYTKLRGDGIVHSGDLQSAPHGAAEFIDMTLSRLPSKVRYVAAQVYRYAGDAFSDMQCHAGWMVRDKVDSNYKSFDIQTVAHKFDLNGTGGYCVPLVVDLDARAAIVTDLYMGSNAFHNNVEGAHGNVAMAAREIAGFTKTKPTLLQLAEAHAHARGAILIDSDSADISFGLAGCTYNAMEVEKILAELL